MSPPPPRNRSSSAIPINPRILTVAIPDVPRIRSVEMREVLVTITDHVGALTESVQEIAGSQSELVGSVIGLRGYIDQAFDRAVAKAAQVAVEEARKVADDTVRRASRIWYGVWTMTRSSPRGGLRKRSGKPPERRSKALPCGRWSRSLSAPPRGAHCSLTEDPFSLEGHRWRARYNADHPLRGLE